MAPLIVSCFSAPAALTRSCRPPPHPPLLPPPPHLCPHLHRCISYHASSHHADCCSFLSSRLPCVATWYDGRAFCSPHGCQRAPYSPVRPLFFVAPPFRTPRRWCVISTPPSTPTAVGGRVARCLLPRPLCLGRHRRNVLRQLRSPLHAAAGAPMTAQTGCRCIPKAVPRGERDQACHRRAPRLCTRR